MILERIAMYFRRPHHNCEAQYPLFSSNFSRTDSAAAMPRLDDVASVAMERRYNKEADTRIIYQLRDEIFTSYYNIYYQSKLLYKRMLHRFTRPERNLWDIFLNGTYEGF